jgi:hypothetical protein
MLHVLCEVVKSAPGETVQMRIPALVEVVNQVEALPQLSVNTLIRKFNVKLLSRLALRTLPGVRIRRTGIDCIVTRGPVTELLFSAIARPCRRDLC